MWRSISKYDQNQSLYGLNNAKTISINVKQMKTISICKLFSSDLALRDSANLLFEQIAKHKEVVIDFAGVRSMTRSFAHQYVTNKKMSDAYVKEINVSEDVKQMFELAAKPVFVASQISHKKIKVTSLTL